MTGIKPPIYDCYAEATPASRLVQNLPALSLRRVTGFPEPLHRWPGGSAPPLPPGADLPEHIL